MRHRACPCAIPASCSVCTSCQTEARTWSVTCSGASSPIGVPTGALVTSSAASGPAMPVFTSRGACTPSRSASINEYATWSTCWIRLPRAELPGSLYIAECQSRAVNCPSRWSRPKASTRSCSPEARVTSTTRARGTRSDADATPATSNPSSPSASRISVAESRPLGARRIASAPAPAASPDEPAAQRVRGAGRSQVDDRERHERDQEPRETPHRPGDVGRHRDGHGRDGRNLHRRERRPVAGAHRDAERARRTRSEDLVEQRAGAERHRAAERDRQRRPRPPQDQEDDRERGDGPDRAELRDRLRQPFEIGSEPVDDLGQVAVDRATRLGPEPADERAGGPDADPDDVARSPFECVRILRARLLGCSSGTMRPGRGQRHAEKVMGQRPSAHPPHGMTSPGPGTRRFTITRCG